jgi:hypothetical protein
MENNHMEKRNLMIIEKLMEELQDEMGYSADDFEERLGRKKPDVEIVKVKSKVEPGIEIESLGDEEEPEFEEMSEMGLEEDPDEKLKNRLLKLRG